MRLYATITSERASKGQGGKALNIRVQAGSEERAIILVFNLESKGEGKTKYDWRVSGLGGDIVFLRSLRAAIGEFEQEYIN